MLSDRIEPAGRKLSRRKVIGATAAAAVGLSLGRTEVSTANVALNSPTVDRVHAAITPIFESMVGVDGPKEYRELPPSLVRFAITEPSATYDLEFRPDSRGDVQFLESIDTNHPIPDAAIQTDWASLREILEGSLILEVALASNKVTVSGNRLVLAPLRRMPAYVSGRLPS